MISSIRWHSITARVILHSEIIFSSVGFWPIILRVVSYMLLPICHYCELQMVGKSTGCAVVVRLSAVPLLEGAAECVEAGILSSLHPQVD